MENLFETLGAAINPQTAKDQLEKSHSTTVAELAFSFLAKRNPFDNIPQETYIFNLMNLQDKLGDEFIEGLAGFYIYAIRNIQGLAQNKAIEETFLHDLKGYNEPGFLPRSAQYREFWLQECK